MWGEAPSSGWRARVRSHPAEWRWVGLWMIGMAVLALLRIGAAPLFDVDEGAFSEATREMLAHGDWGHTTLNGTDRFDKPIFIYWLQAASVSLFGLNEWALRLPSALATWGWATSVVLWIWPRWGLAAALGAGSVLGSSLGVLLIGRAATADAVLNLWLALAAQDLWRHLEASAGSVAARSALRRAAVWMALGILTKGPVAVIVPGAAVMVWVLVSGGRQILPRLRALLSEPVAWSLLVAIALPWYVYALNRHGMVFVEGFFIKHNLQRYGGTLEGHGGSMGYYVVMLPVLLLPWSALILPALARLKQDWLDDPLGRFLWGWAGFVLIFFSLSGTKLPHYALYGITPLAVLAGRALAVWLAGQGRAPRALGGALIVSILAVPLILVAVSVEILRRAPTVKDELYRALLSQPADVSNLWMAAAAAAAVAVGLGFWAWPRRGDAGPGGRGVDSRTGVAPKVLRVALAGGVSAAALVGVLAPWWGQLLQGPVSAAAQVARQTWAAQPEGSPVGLVQWGLHLPSLAVYAQHEAPRRAPRGGELALVRSDQLERLTTTLAQERGGAGASARFDLLFAQGGVSLIRWWEPVQ